ncbi:hypothetical protein PhCBS80983_g05623 [Powellomyces hirtus]|uniref:FAD-binding PCMH-type domain-containing protein n=1 Tax=Powellomyces hirtus TaxID=109895 RepID=A0A507DU51_9FUNG|nr:hypothetical protein PhCBS80983_g05623 [Powellomyces hirtus]
MVSYQLAAAITLLSVTASTHATGSKPNVLTQLCKCSAGDACWPSVAQWDDFNRTVSGRLLTPKPTAWVCYNGDTAACNVLRAQGTNAYYRADRAGSMQNWSWEENGDNGRCVVPAVGASVTAEQCKQGNVPAYAVNVGQASDIQNAVQYAAKNRLKLVVKSTGHDFLGRSTAADSLLIWTHNFKDISVNPSFVPEGAPKKVKGVPVAGVPAVTVTGGMAWGEVYMYVRTNFPQYTVIGGQAATVGATGGYANGGGHGALSPSFGLAVDNFLEVQIVTADGKLRTVNQYQEPDLFWALRGGGGGTYGVTVSITYKLHPTPPAYTGELLILSPTNGTWSAAIQEDIMTVWASETRNLDKQRWGGYFTLTDSTFYGTFVAPTGYAAGLAAFEPIVKGMRGIGGVATVNYTIPFTQFNDWRNFVAGIAFPKTGTDYTGGRSVVASRLIPDKALDNPRRVAQMMVKTSTANGAANGFIGHLVAGPGVREADASGTETSVTPAWRGATYHALWYSGWAANSSETVVQERKDKLNGALQIMRDEYKDTGSYVNEAFAYEPEWQKAFWGRNYAKLLAIKAVYDPLGLFTCNRCVGSELWGVVEKTCKK